MDQNGYQSFQTPEAPAAPAWAQSTSSVVQQTQQVQQAQPQYGQQQYGVQPADGAQAAWQQPQQPQQQAQWQQPSTTQGWQQPQQGYQQGYTDPNGYQQGYQQGYSAPAGPAPKEKMVAGLLAIFLGGLGIHKFYLGKKKPAIIMLVVSLVGLVVTLGIASAAMALIGLIEGIIYLTKSDQEFYQIYVAGDKSWF